MLSSSLSSSWLMYEWNSLPDLLTTSTSWEISSYFCWILWTSVINPQTSREAIPAFNLSSTKLVWRKLSPLTSLSLILLIASLSSLFFLRETSEELAVATVSSEGISCKHSSIKLWIDLPVAQIVPLLSILFLKLLRVVLKDFTWEERLTLLAFLRISMSI